MGGMMLAAEEGDAPLLPKIREGITSSNHASVSGAVFNVSTTIIGAGIMSIPATIKVLGVVPAFLLTVAVAWLAYISVEFLLRFTHAGVSTTYGGLMKESFGWVGSVLVQICVIVSTLGCQIVFLIIMGDVLTGNQQGETIHLGILQGWFGSHWWNSRHFALLFIVVFILLPLVLLPRVDSLRFTSAISVLLAVVFVAVSSVMAIFALIEGKAKSPRLLPDSKTSFFDLFTAVPVIVTAFTFHFNVHPIGYEMEKASDMKKAVKISLVLCAAIYFATGVFGYLLFGEEIMTDVLVNFDQISSSIGSVLNDIVRLSYAFHIMLVFPLLNFSLRLNIHEFFYPNKPLHAKDNTRFLSLTFLLLAICYLAAIAIPNIWYFFQFVGSTTVVCLAFIFPATIVLRDVHGISTRKDRIVAAMMLFLAVFTSTIALSTNIYNSIV